jgi:transmembrane sensor
LEIPNKPFSLDELIQEPAFIAFIKNSDFKDYWKTYLNNFPEEKNTLEKAKTYILGITQVIEPKVNLEEYQEIWPNIEEKTNARLRIFSPYVLRIAASLLFLLGSGWYFLNSFNSEKTLLSEASKDAKLKTVENRSSTLKFFLLPDKSTVKLYPGASLKFPSVFGQKRMVSLEGKAFFDIKKLDHKPLIVFSGNIVTKVLGTSFTIDAEDEKKVNVAVHRGLVSVYFKNKEKQEKYQVLLSANQQVQAVDSDEKLLKSLIEKPLPVNIVENPSPKTYVDISATKLFENLEKKYGVDIKVDREAMKKCVLTTTLDSESLYEQLDIICEAIGAKYSIVETSVIINSGNCE